MRLMTTSPTWQRYGAALVLSSLALALTLWLRPWMAQTPAVLFMLAVFFSAWHGGRGPGIFAGLLGAAAIHVFFLSPVSSWQVVLAEDLAALAVFLMVAVFISWLTAAQKRAGREDRLLAEAGRVLSSSLDYQVRLTSLAQLVVPHLADWCSVDVPEEPAETIRQVAVAHADPAKVAMAQEWRRRFPPDPAARRGVANVLRTGKSEVYPEIADDLLEATTHDSEHLKHMRKLGFTSAMIVPLSARGKTLGAMTLAWAESGRRYTPADLALAEELACRAALAVDNVQLYQEAQALNATLEERVLKRTAELRAANAKLEAEIDERERTEDQLERSRELLRRLSARLQAGREEERTRMAREIHDELGGALTGLKMDIARLRKGIGKHDREALLEITGAMSALVDTTIQTVRRIATELRPGILDDFGLAAAIEWQLQEFQTRAGIECRLLSNAGEMSLDPASSTAVFRVFQETLTNVARHAQASRVEVNLEECADYLLLQVRDNGRGINTDELSGIKSLGLVGMRERIHLLSGELDIQGAPGEGTTVLVKVPLRKPLSGEQGSPRIEPVR